MSKKIKVDIDIEIPILNALEELAKEKNMTIDELVEQILKENIEELETTTKE